MMQLRFYSLLNKTDSKLKDAIPSLVASGIVSPDGKDYKVQPWDGYDDRFTVNETQHIGKKRHRNISEFDKSRCRIKCSETEFVRVSIDDNNEVCEYPEKESTEMDDDAIFWPYIVHKRCDGTNMDSVCVSFLLMPR